MGIGSCEITHYSVHAKQSYTILLQLILGCVEAAFPSAISMPETQSQTPWPLLTSFVIQKSTLIRSNYLWKCTCWRPQCFLALEPDVTCGFRGPSGWLNRSGNCLFSTSDLLLLSAFQDLDSCHRELWKLLACSHRSLSHVMDTDVFQSAMLFLSSAMSRYLIASQTPWLLVPADKSARGRVIPPFWSAPSPLTSQRSISIWEWRLGDFMWQHLCEFRQPGCLLWISPVTHGASSSPSETFASKQL